MSVASGPPGTQEQFAILAELVSEGVVRLDRTGRVLSCNVSALRLLGYEEEGLVGFNLLDLLAEEADRAALAERFAGLASGEKGSCACRLRVRRGDPMEARLRWRGLGGGLGAVAVIEDGEALRRLERERLEALETTEAARRIKGEFLANMSHELRTPISGILGILEMLLGSEERTEQRENLLMAGSAARALLRLMDSILDYSRLEAGVLVLRRERFEPRLVADKVLAGFRDAASAKGLALRGSAAADVPVRVWGDPARLGQLLNSLVGNAVKFTEAGAIALDVTRLPVLDAPADSTARPGATWARLLFAVRDTGPGIPESKQEMIFHIFSQVDGSLARRHEGAGLGLSVASLLAQRMGGRLWVESAPGQGSAFFCALPLEVEDEPGAERGPLQAPAQAEPKPLRILVAEDNPLIQKYLRHFLGKRGHGVELTANGEQALAALQARPFDVALMDVQMPGLDGLEVTRRLRSGVSGPNADIPIIALTAHALQGDRERFLAVGMNDYVSKPVDLKKLLAAIETLTAPGLRARRAALAPDAPEGAPRAAGQADGPGAAARQGDLAQAVVSIRGGSPPPATEPTASPDPSVPPASSLPPATPPPVASDPLLPPVASPPPVAEPGLDRQAVLDGVEGDQDLADKLLALFQAEAPAWRERLWASCRENDLDALLDASHYFVNALSALRADRAAAKARETENQARQGRRDAAFEAAACLEEELGKLLRDN